MKKQAKQQSWKKGPNPNKGSSNNLSDNSTSVTPNSSTASLASDTPSGFTPSSSAASFASERADDNVKVGDNGKVDENAKVDDKQLTQKVENVSISSENSAS